MHSRRAGRGPRVAATVLVVALSLAMLAGCGDTSKAADRYRGQALGVAAKPAPQITLRNSLGTPVKLSDYRGKAVLLSFLYADCPDVCPLIAGKLAAVRKRLGAKAGTVQLWSVSVDPEGDTPARQRLPRAHASREDAVPRDQAQLAGPWRALRRGRERRQQRPAHSSLIYGRTLGQAGTSTSGRPVSAMVHDVPVLARS